MANIRLLTAPDAAAAAAARDQIVGENEERKRLTQILSDDLIAEADRDPQWLGRSSLVFAGVGWHQGVVGIVASRLVERFGKPAAVIAINDGLGKGSLRSVPRVHLGEALAACREHLVKGGGHAMAAGLSIEPAKVAGFAAAFEAHVASRLPAASCAPRTDFDGEAAISELDAGFFQHLEAMAPFGIANPEPVLRLNRVSFIARPRLFGKDGDHLKGALTGPGGGMREFLAWRARKQFGDFSASGSRFDVLVKPQAGRWRGEMAPRLVFVDGCSA
jgi:single-stranded-DNA-specific exonuclease